MVRIALAGLLSVAVGVNAEKIRIEAVAISF